MNNLVEIIKKCQEQEHLTDQQFTALLGVHRSTWSKAKSGNRRLGFKFLRAFDHQFPSVGIFNTVSSITYHQTAQDGFLSVLRRLLNTFLYRFKKWFCYSKANTGSKLKYCRTRKTKSER